MSSNRVDKLCSDCGAKIFFDDDHYNFETGIGYPVDAITLQKHRCPFKTYGPRKPKDLRFSSKHRKRDGFNLWEQ